MRPAAALLAPPPQLAYAPGFVAAAGGATTGVAGAGSAAAASGALGAAPAVTAGSVVIGGLTLGLMIGEAGLRLYNLTQAQQDQIAPLSQLLVDRFTPTSPGQAPAAPGVGLTGWSSGASPVTTGHVAYVNTDENGGGVPVTISKTWEVFNAPGYGASGSVTVGSTTMDLPSFTGTRYQRTGIASARQDGTDMVVVYAVPPGEYSIKNGQGTIGGTLPPSNIAEVSGGGWTPAPKPHVGKSVFTIPSGGGLRGACVSSGNKTAAEIIDLLAAGGSAANPCWYPSGSPQMPSSGGAAQAPSVLETRSTCSGQVVSSRSVEFDRTGSWPSPPANPCSGGVLPSLVEVWEIVPSTGASTRLTTWTAPSVADPNLNPVPGGRLDLQRANPDGSWVSCFSVPGPCAQWYEDPSKAQNYRCTYAGKVVALTECNPYRPSFDTSAKTPYAGPDGSIPPPSPSNPSGEPKTPTPGGEGKPDPTDTASAKCWPNGWRALNPVDWVLKPLGCAFVPTKVPAGIQKIQARMQDSWIFKFAFAGTFAAPVIGLAQTCPDWTVHVGEYAKNVVCDSSYTAAIRLGRPLFTAFMIAVAYAPLMRSVWYASIPLKVTPIDGGAK